MQGLNDFDRMVMASLCPSGSFMLPLLPPDGPADENLADGGLLPLGLGIVSAILLALLAALA
jgi:hypothetical protein